MGRRHNTCFGKEKEQCTRTVMFFVCFCSEKSPCIAIFIELSLYCHNVILCFSLKISSSITMLSYQHTITSHILLKNVPSINYMYVELELTLNIAVLVSNFFQNDE